LEGRPEISRWWSPSVTTGAGQNRFCVPGGRRTRIRSNANAVPAPFQGAHASLAAFPVVTLGLHDRLISAAPPARTFVGKPMAYAPGNVPIVNPRRIYAGLH